MTRLLMAIGIVLALWSAGPGSWGPGVLIAAIIIVYAGRNTWENLLGSD